MPKTENHSTSQPSAIIFFLPFLVKKQFSKVGLSPRPPDTLISFPVLTPQRATSRCCWFPCRSPWLVLTIHGSTQDLSCLRWWDLALPHCQHRAVPLTNRYGDLGRLQLSDEGSFFSPPPHSSPHHSHTGLLLYISL